jgi:hypothetical protein
VTAGNSTLSKSVGRAADDCRYAGKNMKKYLSKSLILLFFIICDNSKSQIISFYPRVDTLYTAGGCTPTQIIASYRYGFNNLDSLQISSDLNTHFWSGISFWSPSNIYYDKVYFLINDSLKQFQSELLIVPVNSYQKTPIFIPFDSVRAFDYRNYFIKLILKNNDIIIDSLSQFCIAKIGNGVKDKTGLVLDFDQLLYNYPNPFNQETTIIYNITKTSKAQILIYNIYGQLIELLVNQTLSPGSYSSKWKTDRLVSGQYFIIFKTGDKLETRKCLLLK